MAPQHYSKPVTWDGQKLTKEIRYSQRDHRPRGIEEHASESEGRRQQLTYGEDGHPGPYSHFGDDPVGNGATYHHADTSGDDGHPEQRPPQVVVGKIVFVVEVAIVGKAHATWKWSETFVKDQFIEMPVNMWLGNFLIWKSIQFGICVFNNWYRVSLRTFECFVVTHRSISPEANGEKNIFFQKLFLFINIVPLKSDTISPTSF